jgi:hypothetical protein
MFFPFWYYKGRGYLWGLSILFWQGYKLFWQVLIIQFRRVLFCKDILVKYYPRLNDVHPHFTYINSWISKGFLHYISMNSLFLLRKINR